MARRSSGYGASTMTSQQLHQRAAARRRGSCAREELIREAFARLMAENVNPVKLGGRLGYLVTFHNLFGVQIEFVAIEEVRL